MRAIALYWPLLPLLVIPFIYWPALINVVERWLSDAEYSHGLVIPFISAYIVYERWGTIKASAGTGSWLGPGLMATALLLFLAGEISALFMLTQVSFVLLLWGIAFAYLGKRSAKLMSAPILILLFAIPLPFFLEVMLTAKMQLLSSQLGVFFIRGMGMPVYLSGNIIDLGRHQLEVVEACSGLRFLYPLMSIGFIVAYFYKAPVAKRVIVFLSTIPITLLMNSVRIALTAVLVERYGVAAIEGTAHDIEGWLVFAFCLLFLFGEIALLEKFTSRRSLLAVLGLEPEPERQTSSTPTAVAFNHGPVYAGVVMLLLAVAGLSTLSHRSSMVAPATHLALFPTELSGWQGVPRPMEERVVDKLRFSDYLMLNFSHPQVIEPINLYVAYYANQRKGESPHSPRVCIPGGGWEIESFERIQFGSMKVNRALIINGGQKQLVYYWFAERGQIVANEYYKKWLLFRDFLLTGRTDGALVRVSIPVIDQRDIGRSDQRIREFIDLAQAPLASYLPDLTSTGPF